MNGNDMAGKETEAPLQLSGVVNELDAELRVIEGALGLQEADCDEGKPEPGYIGMQRRLDEHVAGLADIGRRLEVVKVSVLALKETVG